jgi:polysaccharide biosynthesis protein PelA
MRVWFSILVLSWLILVSAAAGANADPLTPSDRDRTLSRTILALYHSADEATQDQTRIHKYVEMPLNHLGYTLSYWDLKRGLPSAEKVDGAAAVVTWFKDDLPNAQAYLVWAAAQASAGRRFVIFESPGALGKPADLPLINRFLASQGLVQLEGFVADTSQLKIRSSEQAVVGYERPLPKPLPPHETYRRPSNSESGGFVTILSVSIRDRDAEDVLITVGPNGGFIAPGYGVNYDPAAKRVAWLIEPIAFLQRALGPARRPVPDVTTLNGRRIYFSHIDGDGWNNPSRIPQARGLTSSEVVLRDLIAAYPDLPVTVGLITCDIDPTLKGRAEAAEIAQRLYALPQVEAGSHTHTHPFDWGFYERYSRPLELARLRPTVIAAPAKTATTPVSIWPWETPAKVAAPAAAHTIIQPGPPPRYRTQKPFDIGSEVAGSLNAVRALLPPDKQPQVYLWSGNTRPFEGALKATRKAGVRNLNGGDSRLDSDYPSLVYVPPIGRQIGAERQIYAVNSNENTYTNEWKGPFDGFKKLVETHDRTELPRRLKPMNVYYHMYSGERDGALAAVKGHLERARASPVIPIPASQYAAIADGFYDAAIVETGPLAWRIKNRGALQTLRFDDASGATVDLARSTGVTGWNSHAGALYVALDPAHREPHLVLAPSPGAPPPRPYLIESRWQISALAADTCDIEGRAKGFGRGDMTWAGLTPGRYRLEIGAERDGPFETMLVMDDLTPDPDGRLSISALADARDGVVFRLACAP